MHFTKGDTLVLKAAAIDPKRFDPKNPNNPNAVLYEPGTVTTIERIEDELIYLKFPDGEVVPNDPSSLIVFFNRKVDDNLVYMRETLQYGTPKPGLVPYLPTEAHWKNKYRIKVIVELEDRGLKEQVCPNCFEEIPFSNKEQSEDGLTKCGSCESLVLPIDPQQV